MWVPHLVCYFRSVVFVASPVTVLLLLEVLQVQFELHPIQRALDGLGQAVRALLGAGLLRQGGGDSGGSVALEVVDRVAVVETPD